MEQEELLVMKIEANLSVLKSLVARAVGQM